MSQEAKKRLEELANKHTDVYDMTTLLLEYLRQTSDQDSTKHAVVKKALTAWSNDLKAGAASELTKKSAYVANQLGTVMETLERLKEELSDGS